MKEITLVYLAKKISPQKDLKTIEIENIKGQLKSSTVKKIVKKHNFTNDKSFRESFLHNTGLKPSEYKQGLSEKKRFNYKRLEIFFSKARYTDPFIFYISINRDYLFGFLTKDNDTCLELRDILYKEGIKLGLSLKGHVFNADSYFGALYEMLDRKTFFDNYPFFIADEINEFKVKYNKHHNYPIKKPIETLKRLLEEIV
jgi:hypothetical protein